MKQEMQFYAQHGEDRWLNEHWNTLGLPDRGFYVEVGAMDGLEISNTLWLQESKGWRGMLIEPVWDLFQKMKNNRPLNYYEQYAIGTHKRPFNVGAPGWSGFDRRGRATNVPIATLTELLHSHKVPAVDIISIDVEGTELEVWSTLDLKRWKPKICIVEFGSTTDPNLMKEVWARDGYKEVVRLGANLIFLLQ